MPHSRIFRTGLLCSPSMEVQSPNSSWEVCFNRKSWCCPSWSPPGGKKPGCKSDPRGRLPTYSPFWGWWQPAQARRAPQASTEVLQGSEEQLLGKPLLPTASHPMQGEQEMSHTFPVLHRASLDLAPSFTFHTKNPNFLKTREAVQTSFTLWSYDVEQHAHIRRILAKMPFIAVYLYRAYR